MIGVMVSGSLCVYLWNVIKSNGLARLLYIETKTKLERKMNRSSSSPDKINDAAVDSCR
jgi:hypothetical protein